MARIWRNKNVHPSLVRMYNDADIVENIWQFLKKLNAELSYNPEISLLGYISKSNKKICPHRKLYMNVYSGITHRSQKVKTTQRPISGWMDKHIMIYKYNEILLIKKQDHSADTCYYLNESQKHYVK